MNTPLTLLRQEYAKSELVEANIKSDPIEQFKEWFESALHSGVLEPNAMTLSTISLDGKPSARTVLLKEVEKGTFVFYTNYESTKGKEIEKNKWVNLNFWWDKLERQVRISGLVEKVSREQSEAYFKIRPRGSQFGALVSDQSEIIPNREFLEEKLTELKNKYGDDKEIPIPEHWGGYRVFPTEIEFWQGRRNRLHDRIKYSKTENGNWKIERLSP